ncbi:hypothetical protein [Catalinimonas niigatensis]|uniref:hypothetical protein n=1 Tax=Catalinimonas niigatensis TaxID=1397264 RepID=UPI0026654568|nr:hypothetical protein [Catalinimonas niigatensis]WPP52252.1 hypothetical protein PZB72_07645 [Catalinimonas niigatensis]
MNTKYKILALGMGFLLFLNACEEERWGRMPNLSDHIGAITLIDVNEEKSFFNASGNLAGQEVEFEIDVDGFEVTEVSSVDIELTFTENDATTDAEGNPADLTYDLVMLKSVNTFPSTVSVTVEEVIAAIQGFKPDFTIEDLEVGDQFNLTFPIHTADGRRLTTALNSDLCQEPVQPSFGGCNVSWSVSCPSEIPEGTYTAVTDAASTDPCCTVPLENFTYEVTLTEEAPGEYALSDIYAGLYIEWYTEYGATSEEERTFTDVCNTLSSSFNDLFGGGVTITGTYDPATGIIQLEGSNTFGDVWSTTLTPN